MTLSEASLRMGKARNYLYILKREYRFFFDYLTKNGNDEIVNMYNKLKVRTSDLENEIYTLIQESGKPILHISIGLYKLGLFTNRLSFSNGIYKNLFADTEKFTLNRANRLEEIVKGIKEVLKKMKKKSELELIRYKKEMYGNNFSEISLNLKKEKNISLKPELIAYIFMLQKASRREKLRDNLENEKDTFKQKKIYNNLQDTCRDLVAYNWISNNYKRYLKI